MLFRLLYAIAPKSFIAGCLIALLLISCGGKNELELFKKAGIETNEMLFSREKIDTTYLIADYDPGIYRRNDTLGFRVFDSLGRIKLIVDPF